MDKKTKKSAFTLAETIAALTIATMIMIAVVAVYSSVRKAQGSIDKRLKEGYTATEILQRISEDIDRLALPSADVTVSIKNRLDIENFQISQLIIESKIYDKDNKPQTFEKIVWQSRVSTDGNELIIYRAHSGYSMEDKMLEEGKKDNEREVYVPVCSGVSVFAMEVTDGNNVTPEWADTAGLPQAIKLSISLAPREPNVIGGFSAPIDSVKTRTVALNRFRQIPYTFVYKAFGDANDVNDANGPKEPNQPHDTNSTRDPNNRPNLKPRPRE